MLDRVETICKGIYAINIYLDWSIVLGGYEMTFPITYDQAARAYDRQEPPEYPPEVKELPGYGTCPYCHGDLELDESDDSLPRCNTSGCQYDNGITEEENRRLWEMVESKKQVTE